MTALIFAALVHAAAAAPPDESENSEYRRRVDAVRGVKGFVALWDFVKRDGGRFAAHQAKGDAHDFRLDAVNYVRDYWNAGRAATYDDFPLLGRGPFGQAVRFRNETDRDFRPCLLVPRERLHNSGLDVKGPGQSVSMVAWLIRESGNHAIAGIWHEGTDLAGAGGPAQRVERGRRQYALFAVTPEVIPSVAPGASGDALDRAWSVVGFSFDNRRNTVTAYLNGKASAFWVDNPDQRPFFEWPYKAWLQAELRRMPGVQPGEDPAFPESQLFQPPEGKPRSRRTIESGADTRVETLEYPFTKVRVTLRRGADGKFATVRRELVALRANPFWFPHDLYSPAAPQDGGPFTIGRVIHTGRNVGFVGYIGGVAVFNRALSAGEMRRLAAIARTPITCPGSSPRDSRGAQTAPERRPDRGRTPEVHGR